MHSLKLGSCTLSSVFIHLLLDFSLHSIIFVIWLILAVMASIAIAHTAYRVSHETWLLVNSFKCLLPYTVLDIKYFLQFISVRKYLTQIYIKIWLVCLFVCLYPINVKTAEPIGPKFFCGTSRDHRKGLWMIEILKICVLKVFNFAKKFKFLKIRDFF